MRAEARQRRASLGVAGAAEAVAGHALRILAIGDKPVYAGFWAISSELDPAPLLAVLHARGDVLCLPFVAGAGQPLGFRRYRPGDVLTAGPHGTREPLAAAATTIPTVVFVPLLAFDRKGWRLGYGGGYYDRTLRALRQAGRVRAIGLAYAEQEVPALPHEASDERLDHVVTEQGVIACAEGE